MKSSTIVRNIVLTGLGFGIASSLIACGGPSITRLPQENPNKFEVDLDGRFIVGKKALGDKEVALLTRDGNAQPFIELELKDIRLKDGKEQKEYTHEIKVPNPGKSVRINHTFKTTGMFGGGKIKPGETIVAEADFGILTNRGKLERTSTFNARVSPDGKSVTVSGVVNASPAIAALQQGQRLQVSGQGKQNDGDIPVFVLGTAPAK
ncbi:MAG: hypothetical protein ACRCXZ_00580 [Patescibacteria group bacterium]